jgi:2-dehydro-3-deoxygluconokinase
MAEVACIGECMIELSEHADGRITRAFGGDTLNTALYLARLGIATDYVTALGDDAWSDEMIAAWQTEGIGTNRVARIAGRMPGLYVIQTDTRGERRFSYWRDRAPAREIFAGTASDGLVQSLPADSTIYLSGISLSLYGADGRARLFDGLEAARSAGTRVAFDTNFRPRGWPDRDEARAAYQQALASADLIFASEEDLALLYGVTDASPLWQQRGRAEIVLKFATPSCRVVARGMDGAEIDAVIAAPPVARVVDTTAAGDSFAAAYLAARLRSASPPEAARAGHRLAGRVVQHPGAIIPRSAMPG